MTSCLNALNLGTTIPRAHSRFSHTLPRYTATSRVRAPHVRAMQTPPPQGPACPELGLWRAPQHPSRRRSFPPKGLVRFTVVSVYILHTTHPRRRSLKERRAWSFLRAISLLRVVAPAGVFPHPAGSVDGGFPDATSGPAFRPVQTSCRCLEGELFCYLP